MIKNIKGMTIAQLICAIVSIALLVTGAPLNWSRYFLLMFMFLTVTKS